MPVERKRLLLRLQAIELSGSKYCHGKQARQVRKIVYKVPECLEQLSRLEKRSKGVWEIVTGISSFLLNVSPWSRCTNMLNKRHGRHLPDRSIIQHLSLSLQRNPPVLINRTPLLPTSRYTSSFRVSSPSHHCSTNPISVSTDLDGTSCIECDSRNWQTGCEEGVPDCGCLQYILHHADSEAVAVVFW